MFLRLTNDDNDELYEQ